MLSDIQLYRSDEINIFSSKIIAGRSSSCYKTKTNISAGGCLHISESETLESLALLSLTSKNINNCEGLKKLNKMVKRENRVEHITVGFDLVVFGWSTTQFSDWLVD